MNKTPNCSPSFLSCLPKDHFWNRATMIFSKPKLSKHIISLLKNFQYLPISKKKLKSLQWPWRPYPLWASVMNMTLSLNILSLAHFILTTWFSLTFLQTPKHTTTLGTLLFCDKTPHLWPFTLLSCFLTLHNVCHHPSYKTINCSFVYCVPPQLLNLNSRNLGFFIYSFFTAISTLPGVWQ